MEKLHTCTKKLKALYLVSNSDKTQIEELFATISKQNKTIKLLETRATDDKKWSEKTSEDRDEWANRVEKLEGEVDHCKRIAQWLEQEKGLKEGDFDILAAEMEVILRDLNEMEYERGLVKAAERKKIEKGVQRDFEEAVNKKVEEIMADNEDVKKVAERIKRNLSMSNGTKLVLHTQQEINRRLSDSLDEEQNIVKERNNYIQQLLNMVTERDIQVIAGRLRPPGKEGRRYSLGLNRVQMIFHQTG